jgi:hypothetical protein
MHRGCALGEGGDPSPRAGAKRSTVGMRAMTATCRGGVGYSVPVLAEHRGVPRLHKSSYSLVIGKNGDKSEILPQAISATQMRASTTNRIAGIGEKMIARILIFAVGLNLSGCASFMGNELAGQWRVNAISREEVKEEKENGIDKVDLDAGIKAASDEQKRNDLQNKLIRLSDTVCEQHKGNVIANGSLNNFMLSVPATALSAVSSIVTGAAARNYAVASTILGTTRAQYNADIYYGVIAPAIVREIAKDRTAQLSKILPNQSLGLKEYGAEAAVRDALDYHYRCSFLFLSWADPCRPR